MPNKGYNVPRYAKNVTKSVGRMGASVIKTQIPVMADTFASSQEIYRNFRNMMMQSRSSIKRHKTLGENTYLRTAKNILKNAKEDFKSGNLYNEERAMQQSQEGMTQLLTDMTGDDEQIFDSSAFDRVRESSTAAAMRSGRKSSSAITRNATKNAEYLGELSISQHTQDMMLSTKNHIETMKAFRNLESIGMSIIDFNSNVLASHILKTQKYQDDSLNE